MRTADITRDTQETKISLKLNIEGTGKAEIETGVAFLDHMLQLFARHGYFDLSVSAKGDLEVDYHHLVEDMALLWVKRLNRLYRKKQGFSVMVFSFCLWMKPLLLWQWISATGDIYFTR